nr:TauD/TfdA family dioxygenase [Paraburkholderia acidisoli]
MSAQPITPSIGAEVSGVRLGAGLDDHDIAALRALLVRHKVLVFRDQDIAPADHVAFARRFGPLEIHPVFPHHADHPELVLLGGDGSHPARENIYHSDVSWREIPSLGSILRCVECPPSGGDTLWVNMALAYEGLPAAIREAIDNLHAVHDMLPGFIDRIAVEKRCAIRAEFPPVVHPVVRVHPESGEKILYVNEGFTTHLLNFTESVAFRGMPEFATGARALLDYLFDQARRPEYQMRLRWQKNTVVFWDNRATQHYAIQDYFPAVRRMMRATITGERP